MKQEDKAQIENHIAQIIKIIGDNPNRVGLKDTPRRVANAYYELFSGYNSGAKPKITVFPNGTDGLTYDQMIIDSGTFNSFCEHHIMSFSGKYYFAYIPHPKGNIIGLSKVARVVDYYSARLQVQERLTQQIVTDLWNALSSNTKHAPLGMAIVMKANHSCKSMRGVKKPGEMTTIELKGNFKKELNTRTEFFNMIKDRD